MAALKPVRHVTKRYHLSYSYFHEVIAPTPYRLPFHIIRMHELNINSSSFFIDIKSSNIGQYERSRCKSGMEVRTFTP